MRMCVAGWTCGVGGLACVMSICTTVVQKDITKEDPPDPHGQQTAAIQTHGSGPAPVLQEVRLAAKERPQGPIKTSVHDCAQHALSSCLGSRQGMLCHAKMPYASSKCWWLCLLRGLSARAKQESLQVYM